MLGCYFLVIHRAVMTLVVQFTAMARLGQLVVLYRVVYLAPSLTKPFAQRMGTNYIAGESQAGHHNTVPIDGKARAARTAIQSLFR